MMKKLLLLSILSLSFALFNFCNAQTELWSTAQDGGGYGTGGIFKIDLNGGGYSRAHDFISEFPGMELHSTPCLASNGKLYAMTRYGGTHDNGVIFSFDPYTNTYSRLINFDGINGGHPLGDLMQASNGKLYGMTSNGGSGGGVLFSFDPATNVYAKLRDFGSAPEGGLVQATNGKLYGMAKFGGANSQGVLFSFDPSSNVYTELLDFAGSSNGSYPIGNLTKATNGKLYGMTEVGGINNIGVLFSFDPATNFYSKLLDFNDTLNGSHPKGSLMQASNGNLYGTTTWGGAYSNGVLFSFNPFGNFFTKLVEFRSNHINGSDPYGNGVVETNGKLYGMTSSGGFYGKGALFSFDPSSAAFTKLFDFDGANGYNPQASLTKANGKLYGMTTWGGTAEASGVGVGVLFEFDPATNTYTKRIDFNASIEGANAHGSLVQATNGKLYGMTPYGGATGDGVIFSVDASTNIYTKLFDFSGTASGSSPDGSLMQATNGKLYGMTLLGGVNNFGVIFSFDPSSNSYARLLDFNGSANGRNPYGDLVQASNGKLYGMASSSVTSSSGVLFSFDPATNTYAKLLDFTGTANGSVPTGSLMQANNGKLYGMTSRGGTNDYGVLFSFDPLGNVYTKLFDFNAATGRYPNGGLMQANNGKLYGMTTTSGVLFSFDISSNTYSGFFDFTNFADGISPSGNLVQASNGKLYGLTFKGGGGSPQGNGVLFSFDPATNTYLNLRTLNFPDASNPHHSSFIEINPSITSGITTSHSIATYLCPASIINVSYTALGTYNPGNVFTAQLSDSTGNFAGAVTIGSVASLASGTIIVTIPPGTPSGSGYRIRVVSSNPASTGNDNGSGITIRPFPSVTVTANGSAAICSGDLVVLTANAGTGVSYQWQLNGTNITGAITSSYSASTAGNYSCVVTGSCSSATSNPLTVSYANIPPPAAITAAGPTTNCPGSGAVTLYANVGAGLSYQWKMNGVAVSGAIYWNYNANYPGSYTCLVSNSCGSITSNAISFALDSLILPVPTVTANGLTTFCSGGSVILNTYIGYGLSYQWKNNGGIIPGATSYSYTATVSGSYTCVVTNACGSTTSNAIVITVNTVLPTATVTATGSVAFCPGGSVLLNASTGTGFTYQWKNNGAVIPGATSSSYSATAGGSYTCVVTNTCGSTLSNAVTTITFPVPPATITAAGPVAFCSGDSVSLNANTGTGLTYQWKNNGGVIPGATSSSYTATGSGAYTCVVSNSNCNATSNSIAVTVSPFIATITAAGSVTICSGDSVILNVNTGTAFTYQWKNNGGIIPGATTFSYAATAGGSYTCVVTNTCGVITSNAIAITVNAAPAATVTAAGATTFCSGGSVVLNANTGAGLTYQWKNNGGAIAGATTSSYTATAAGTYTCVVSNSSCSATSNFISVTANSAPAMPGGMHITGGNARVCPGDARTYTIGTIPGAVSYSWIAPAGAVITGGQGTTSIHVTYTAGFTSNGILKVRATNNCGPGSYRTLTIQRNLPATPGTISGPVSVCHATVTNYSIVPVASATTYAWIVPAGAVIQGPQHGTNISVLWGTTGGTIRVNASNNCGTSGWRSLLVSMPCRETSHTTIENNFEVSVYPNPASDHFTIKVSSPGKGNYLLLVHDVTGRTVERRENISIDESFDFGYELSSGVYFAEVIQGDVRKVLRLVKSE